MNPVEITAIIGLHEVNNHDDTVLICHTVHTCLVKKASENVHQMNESKLDAVVGWANWVEWRSEERKAGKRMKTKEL